MRRASRWRQRSDPAAALAAEIRRTGIELQVYWDGGDFAWRVRIPHEYRRFTQSFGSQAQAQREAVRHLRRAPDKDWGS